MQPDRPKPSGSMSAPSLPSGFFLHENSGEPLDLWVDLIQSIAARGGVSHSYFIHRAVLLVGLLDERGFVPPPGCHVVACALALRGEAVAPPAWVLPAGLAAFSTLLESCSPFHHLATHYPDLISPALTRPGSTPEWHLQLNSAERSQSVIAEALRLVYGLSVQSEFRISLGMSEGQAAVLREDPATAARFAELEQNGRIDSSPNPSIPRILF